MHKAGSISIIGGADGPTSVFLCGKGQKEKNIFRRIKNARLNRRYKIKREKAGRQIVPGAHSLLETVQYMQKQYGAVEADVTYPYYEERRHQMKFSLIQREQPELIGADKRLLPPEDMDWQNQEALCKWMQEVDEWTNHCMELADKVSEEVFPVRYHLYIIDCGKDGRIEMEAEERRGFMGMTTSGDMKKMQKITKDIYRYYGVTKEDIETKSDRYRMLLAELAQ